MNLSSKLLFSLQNLVVVCKFDTFTEKQLSLKDVCQNLVKTIHVNMAHGHIA